MMHKMDLSFGRQEDPPAKWMQIGRKTGGESNKKEQKTDPVRLAFAPGRLSQARQGFARVGTILALLVAAVSLSLAQAQTMPPQTVLRIFIGNAQRIEVTREMVDPYMLANPGIKVEIETGGINLEQQQQYLGSTLSSKSPALDLILIDVLRPAQWAAAQWIEPLDAYLGTEKEALLARYLPASRAAGIMGGKVVALPYFTDALFLYYRKDLLEKYGISPPRTWDALKAAAQKVLEGELNPNLHGFMAAGAPVESTVCSYLVPLWAAGEDVLKNGRLNPSNEAARKPFTLWSELKDAKVTPSTLSEVTTDRIRQEFQAGNLIFGMTWGYAWNRLQNDAGSAVKDKVGVFLPPGFSAEPSATCLGGWQVAVSAFSKNKAEAVKLARHLSSPDISRKQAMLAAHLPVFAPLYADPEVLKANAWFAEALPALQAARARPVSSRYSEVSEIIRTNMSAFLAGRKSADAAIADMTNRLGVIFR